ncbi:ribosomal protein S9 [Bacteroidales bacterium 6E]|jgi:small subunit ribosomal protein S9|nr:ribosomal protein S9 [Bacteroidales bacterium 6E]
MEVTNTLGRRKTAVARVYITPGKGNIVVNNRQLSEYFPTEMLQVVAKQALTLLGVEGNYDVKANIDGGGITGQAEALRLGIARALVEIDAENRPKLKHAGFLTRDPREVERKKPGQPKARKRFQFSKR